MIHYLSSDRNDLIKKLHNHSIEFDDRFRRYQINYSIAIVFISEDIDLSFLTKYIRKSDKYIALQNNLCAIIFDHTDDEQGIKAANNFLSSCHNHFYSTSLFTSIVTTSDYSNAQHMINTLFDLLHYAITYKMDNYIIDNSQLIYKYGYIN